jgi:hypothetical protein
MKSAATLAALETGGQRAQGDAPSGGAARMTGVRRILDNAAHRAPAAGPPSKPARHAASHGRCSG